MPWLHLQTSRSLKSPILSWKDHFNGKLKVALKSSSSKQYLSSVCKQWMTSMPVHPRTEEGAISFKLLYRDTLCVLLKVCRMILINGYALVHSTIYFHLTHR